VPTRPPQQRYSTLQHATTNTMFGLSDLGLQMLPKHLRALETSFASGLIFCNAISKRALCADLKPFWSIFSPKAIFMNGVKSCVLPSTLMVNEYNNFMLEHGEIEETTLRISSLFIFSLLCFRPEHLFINISN
jgi:hypothetical protein